MNIYSTANSIAYKINDFINPAVIYDAKLVCKFIKEAMFLREHPSVNQN